MQAIIGGRRDAGKDVRRYQVENLPAGMKRILRLQWKEFIYFLDEKRQDLKQSIMHAA